MRSKNNFNMGLFRLMSLINEIDLIGVEYFPLENQEILRLVGQEYVNLYSE